ncbi:IclR family transcriptional regulator [Kribbella sp. VKM Ac-2527]|uniref:IclR family transcriptional regulator n=1 Tax=Kribbella caucasensis TaxID=2512215 RepID=A0A4V3CAN8_9ACTN|nr:IclR family transcriptional regulator [Kribbella sp. VKM Ac-2527]
MVGRLSVLFRVVSQAEPAGASTSALARDSELSRPTVHRLLTALRAQGLVERDADTGNWLLGPEFFLLSITAAPRYDVRSVAQPWVRRLAEATGESAFFSVRRGDETVCLIREDGAFPIRSHVLYEGARFPLGVVSAGLAVLAFMHPREVDNYLAGADLTERYGPRHSAAEVHRRLDEVRSKGWALNPGLVVEGSWGMAAAVFDANEEPIGALTLTGIEARFGPKRQRELGPLLLREAHSLGRVLRQRAERRPS